MDHTSLASASYTYQQGTSPSSRTPSQNLDVEQMAEWIEKEMDQRIKKGRNWNLKIWRPSFE